MDKKEANHIVRALFDKESRTFLTKEDKFELKEALRYLSEVEHDGRAMANLGGIYYEEENYPLAEKYYLSSYEAGYKDIASGLGFIYFYGRTGTPDYVKAMRYFSESAEKGDLEAAMKIADMYRDGLGVEADKKEYERRVRKLYEEAQHDDNAFAPVPELAHRLAAIDIEEGNIEEARSLLMKGRLYITTRIRYSAFWGNFIVARRIESLMDKLGMIDHRMPRFFDLLELLKKTKRIRSCLCWKLLYHFLIHGRREDPREIRPGTLFLNRGFFPESGHQRTAGIYARILWGLFAFEVRE